MSAAPSRIALAAALFALLSTACGEPMVTLAGRQNPPQRSSPVLEPTAGAALTNEGAILDLRRDGVVAVPSEAGLDIRRVEAGGTARTLLTLAGRDAVGARLVSRADDHLAVATWDRLHVLRGGAVTDLTPRLEAAFVLARPTDLYTVVALDLAEDGTVTAAMTVGGQGKDAPYGQLCTLAPSGADRCEGIDALDPEFGAGQASAVLVEGSRIWVVVSERLYSRQAGGAWSPLSGERIVDLRAVEGGRIAYVRDSGTDSSLVVLDAGGAEERRVDGAWTLAGHAARGVWEVTIDSQGDGSCNGGFHWGSCSEPLLWTQLVVWYVGATRIEVAHLDQTPGNGLFDRRMVPLADGSLRLEIGEQVFTLAAP